MTWVRIFMVAGIIAGCVEFVETFLTTSVIVALAVGATAGGFISKIVARAIFPRRS